MPQTLHPVDKGWAWVILIGVFFTQFMGVGFIRSYGIFFVAFQEKFTYSAGILSVVSGVQFFCHCFTSLIVTNILLKRWSVRMCCIIGVSLQCLGVMLSTFFFEPIGLILSQGVIYGTGFGFMFFTGLLIVSQYFLHRRYIATIVASCGSPVGGIVVPLINRYLLTLYGIQGALLIVCGLFLNQFLFVILFTPPSEYYSPIQNQNLEKFAGNVNKMDTRQGRDSQHTNEMDALDNTTFDGINKFGHSVTSPECLENVRERDPLAIPDYSKTTQNDVVTSDNTDLCHVNSDVRTIANENNSSSNQCDELIAMKIDGIDGQDEGNGKTRRNMKDG